MKYLSFIFILSTSLFVQTMAQNQVNFEFSDGISNVNVKNRMEAQLSRLLTAINEAEAANREINFSGIDIDPMASQTITALWENAHFRCLDDDIVEHCLSIKSNGRTREYQARNIAVEMKPVDAAYTDDVNQEVCVNFNLAGKITDFNIAMGIHQYTRLMKEGIKTEDVEERTMIIKFCEEFRTAYMKRDLKYLEAIFSDDALIITGKVFIRKKSEIQLSKKDYEYTTWTKKKYLAHMKDIFNNPRTGTINVNFSDYRIVRHNSKRNYYGVTLFQNWRTDAYQDDGIVFLLWDFEDKEHPKIEVRTWQPMDTDENEVFTINRFKLR